MEREKLLELLNKLELASESLANAPIHLSNEEASAWCSGVATAVQRIRNEVAQ